MVAMSVELLTKDFSVYVQPHQSSSWSPVTLPSPWGRVCPCSVWRWGTPAPWSSGAPSTTATGCCPSPCPPPAAPGSTWMAPSSYRRWTNFKVVNVLYRNQLVPNYIHDERKFNNIINTHVIPVNNYEWAKRTKFLLAVIYGSPCHIKSALKPLKKSEKCEIKMYDHFSTSWIV